MKPIDDFGTLREAFKDGSIESATTDELQKAVGFLTNTAIQNDSIKHIAVIMSDGIHNIMLRRILDEQEKRNNKAQFWFMVLSLAGVIAAIVQVCLA